MRHPLKTKNTKNMNKSITSLVPGTSFLITGCVEPDNQKTGQENPTTTYQHSGVSEVMRANLDNTTLPS